MFVCGIVCTCVGWQSYNSDTSRVTLRVTWLRVTLLAVGLFTICQTLAGSEAPCGVLIVGCDWPAGVVIRWHLPTLIVSMLASARDYVTVFTSQFPREFMLGSTECRAAIANILAVFVAHSCTVVWLVWALRTQSQGRCGNHLNCFKRRYVVEGHRSI